MRIENEDYYRFDAFIEPAKERILLEMAEKLAEKINEPDAFKVLKEERAAFIEQLKSSERTKYWFDREAKLVTDPNILALIAKKESRGAVW